MTVDPNEPVDQCSFPVSQLVLCHETPPFFIKAKGNLRINTILGPIPENGIEFRIVVSIDQRCVHGDNQWSGGLSLLQA